MMRRNPYLSFALVACVACGSVKGAELADAPIADDAPVVTRGTVKVTVLDPSGTGAAAVGANVVFLDPDGTLVKKAATDTLGKASADVLPGASVTAILVVGTATQLQTVLAIKPGDDLVIGTKSLDSTTTGTYSITVPTFAAAVQYAVSGPCNGNTVAAPPSVATVTIPITVYNYCKLATMDIVVTALDTNNTVVAVLEKPNVPFVVGGATSIAGPYQSARNFTASYTNVNPVVTNLGMSREVPDVFGLGSSTSMASPGASLTLGVTGAVGATAHVTTNALNATRSVQVVSQTVAGNAATYGLDVGGTLLPWLNAPVYDAANRKITAPFSTIGSSTDKPDAFRLVASYRRTDPAMASYTWTFYAPEPTDITFPTLPAELAPIAPTATDTVTANVSMFEADNVTGYDGVRSDLGGAFALYTGGLRTTATRIRLSRWPQLIRL